MESVRINELDLTRAGVISVQKVLPEGRSTWQVEYEVGDTLYRIQGDAMYGRPHGSDNDILLALQTLFFRAGCPTNDRIEVVPAELLRLGHLDLTGRTYQRLRDALMRLSGVKWSMIKTSYNAKDKRHAGSTTVVGLISELRLVDYASGTRQPFDSRQLDDRMPIEVIFSPTFADSIRAGLYQILDSELLSRLTQPPARSLYRVIQAHRVQKDGSLASELRVPLRDWCRACGIEEDRADNAKRALLLAHTHLEEQGYLKGVEISGRGFNAEVLYRFSNAAQPELADLLMGYGVSRPVAESLSADYPERIRSAIGLVEEKTRTGWKPRSLSAAVVDAVKEPSKWGYAAPEKTKKAPVKRRGVEKEAEPPQPTTREVIDSLIKVKLGRPLSPMALDILGEFSEEQLLTVKSALLKPKKEEALALLQAVLNAPL